MPRMMASCGAGRAGPPFGQVLLLVFAAWACLPPAQAAPGLAPLHGTPPATPFRAGAPPQAGAGDGSLPTRERTLATKGSAAPGTAALHSFIVVLDRDSDSNRLDALVEALSLGHADADRPAFEAELDFVYRPVVPRAAPLGAAAAASSGDFVGLAARLSDAALNFARASPSVAYVEYDQPIELDAVTVPVSYGNASGVELSWGLDRIDQPFIPLDGQHRYTTYGAVGGSATGTVDVYVVDSGVYINHADFEGRAANGNTVESGDFEDCVGHGTHVAATIGGRKYGVAKNARLVAVKVFRCVGVSLVSDVVQGLKWVQAQASANGSARRSVINLSLTTKASSSSSLIDEVEATIAQGIVVVAAAGNKQAPACDFAPASVPGAITVTAHDQRDQLASFSNVGSCVDIVAPGHDILSAGPKDPHDTQRLNGTSFAAPHVAGAAASFLNAHPSASVAQVTAAIKCAALIDSVGNTSSTGTSGLLLQVPPGGWEQTGPDAQCAAVECTVGASGAGVCSGHGTCVAGGVDLVGTVGQCACDCGYAGRRCELSTGYHTAPFPEGSLVSKVLTAGDAGAVNMVGHLGPDTVVAVVVPSKLAFLTLTLCSKVTDFDTLMHLLPPSKCPRPPYGRYSSSSTPLRTTQPVDTLAVSDDGAASACPSSSHSAPYTPSALTLANVPAGTWYLVVEGWNSAYGNFELTVDADGDCFVGAWSAWSQCTHTCEGTRTRARNQTSAQFSGEYAACPALSEDETCNGSCGGAGCGAGCVAATHFESAPCAGATPRVCSACRAACAAGEFEAAPCGGGDGTSDRTCQACTSCSANGTHYQVAACTSTQDAQCALLATCTPGAQYETTAPTPTTDRVCAACSQPAECPSGQFESVACAGTHDRTCSACTVCNATNQFASTVCGGSTDAVCAPLTECTPAAEFEQTAPTASSDRVCAACSVCSVAGGTYEAAPCGNTTDTTCAPLRVCAAGVEYETTAPTPTSDRGCTACRSACAAGVDWESTPCGGTSGNHDRQCTACSPCNQTTHFEANACNATADSVCRLYSPACAAGEWQSAAPTPTSDRECRTCTMCGPQSYEQSPCGPTADRRCAPWRAPCPAGVEYEIVAPNATHDRVCSQCTMCPAEHFEASACGLANDRVCSPWSTCVSGVSFESAAPDATHDRNCSTCRTCPAAAPEVAACTTTRDTQCGDGHCPFGTFVNASAPAVGLANATSAAAASCVPCSPTCGSGSFETRACNPLGTDDRQCTACASACTVGAEYESTPCSGSQDRVCSACSSCGANQFEVAACGGSHDISCAACFAGAGPPCDVDCQVGAWGPWQPCSNSCGRGSRLRQRPVLVEPRYGGAACASVSEVVSCDCPSFDTGPGSDAAMCLAPTQPCATVLVRMSMSMQVTLRAGNDTIDDAALAVALARLTDASAATALRDGLAAALLAATPALQVSAADIVVVLRVVAVSNATASGRVLLSAPDVYELVADVSVRVDSADGGDLGVALAALAAPATSGSGSGGPNGGGSGGSTDNGAFVGFDAAAAMAQAAGLPKGSVVLATVQVDVAQVGADGVVRVTRVDSGAASSGPAGSSDASGGAASGSGDGSVGSSAGAGASSDSSSDSSSGLGAPGAGSGQAARAAGTLDLTGTIVIGAVALAACCCMGLVARYAVNAAQPKGGEPVRRAGRSRGGSSTKVRPIQRIDTEDEMASQRRGQRPTRSESPSPYRGGLDARAPPRGGGGADSSSRRGLSPSRGTSARSASSGPHRSSSSSRGPLRAAEVTSGWSGPAGHATLAGDRTGAHSSGAIAHSSWRGGRRTEGSSWDASAEHAPGSVLRPPSHAVTARATSSVRGGMADVAGDLPPQRWSNTVRELLVEELQHDPARG